MSSKRIYRAVADSIRPIGPFRWVETHTGAFGINAPQRGAGVGMSLRVPASLTLHAVAYDGRRVTSLNVSGASEAELEKLFAAVDQPIKRNELVSLFKKLPTPDEDDLKHLELALNIMRVTTRAPDFPLTIRNKVKGDIIELLRSLPVLISLQEQDRKFAPESPGAILHGSTILAEIQ